MARFRFSFWRRRQSTRFVFTLVALCALLLFLRTDDDDQEHPSDLPGQSSLYLPNTNDSHPVQPVLHSRGKLLAVPKKLAKQLATRWQASSTRSGPPQGLTENELSLGGRWKGRETTFDRGIPGFMMLSNLYLHKGILLCVTSNASSVPVVSRLLSAAEVPATGHRGPAGPDRYRVLAPEEANALFGTAGDGVARLAGTSFLFNDAGNRGLLQHFFHFVVENVVGAWKVLASTPEAVQAGRVANVVFPSRFVFPRSTEWRDTKGMNSWFLNTALPSTSVEDKTIWDERAKTDNVYVFDQVVLIDRGNYHRDQGKNGIEASRWNKMTADVLLLPSPPGWFEPVRSSVMKRLGITDDHAHRDRGRKVITYINRQDTPGAARLLPADHKALIAALHSVERDRSRYGNKIDVYIVREETLDQRAMLQLLAKTDILLSARTPQQSHQLWMRHGSALFEFFEPGHYTHDSEMLSQGFGHTHHVVHKDKLYNWQEEGPNYKQSNGGNQIPVDASFVISQIDAYLIKQGFQL